MQSWFWLTKRRISFSLYALRDECCYFNMLKVVEYPDKRLREVSKSVDVVDDATRELMDEMLQLMYETRGVGLAAVQVGILKRIFVMDVACGFDEDDRKIEEESLPVFVINPEIITMPSEILQEVEGCLSIPGVSGIVPHNSHVKLKYLDYNGKERIVDCRGLLSKCVQHENDHLNGKLWIDRLSEAERKNVLEEYSELSGKKFGTLCV